VPVIAYDTTKFVEVRIEEVFKTLLEAIPLVVLAIFVERLAGNYHSRELSAFVDWRWRSPMSWASLNTLTTFAPVLAATGYGRR